MRSVASVALLILIFASSTSARTWYVTPDGTGDAPTIQAAIDSAAVDDEIVLACGTYEEPEIRLKSDVPIRSVTGSADCVTIDGRGTGRCFSADGVSTSLTGLTITGGRAGEGGGARFVFSELLLVGCAFVDNEALYYGGGVYAYGCDISFRGCLFLRNRQMQDSIPFLGGGALALPNSLAEVYACTVVANFALNRGSGFFATPDADVRIERSVVAFNYGSALFGGPSGSFFSSSCAVYYDNLTGPAGACDDCLFEDPQFCDAASEDFHLQWGSPCLPPNSGGCDLIGAFGFGGCNSVSVTRESWGRLKARFRSPTDDDN